MHCYCVSLRMHCYCMSIRMHFSPLHVIMPMALEGIRLSWIVNICTLVNMRHCKYHVVFVLLHACSVPRCKISHSYRTKMQAKILDVCFMQYIHVYLHTCSLANALSDHEKLEAEIKRLSRLAQIEENKASTIDKVFVFVQYGILQA